MTNFKLNKIIISILGVIITPGLLANAGVPSDGFGQDVGSSSAATKIDTGSKKDPKDEVIDEFGTFEIAVEDVPLPQVLNMLAIQSRRNIITSKRVGSISITANLFDVTFYEALDGILHIASLCYEEQGNFIYVMTCDEKLQRAQANRVLEDRVFYLDHISPGDAESLAKPLLSTKGSMSKLGEIEGGFQPGVTDAGGDRWAHEPVLVVRDYGENLEAIQALLKDVDTPPKQVMVESTILVTKAKGDYAWGMDVSVLLDADFTSLMNPLNPVSWLQNLQQQPQSGTGSTTEGNTPTNSATAIQSTVGDTSGKGGFKFGILSDNVAVFLRLLDEVSDSTTLARPRILALNRQRAQVLVGERVAYLSTTQTETAATQTVQFLETGINLILRPFISRDGSIRMELYPSVSDYRIRKIGDGSAGGYTEVPDEFTNEITTNVRVRDGETVVLGGLFMDKATINRRSVPGLGDIPIAGNAFKGQDDDTERKEIIFLVTPTIVREEVMTAASKEADMLVKNVVVGVREGLLPWARETLATNSTHDAYQALETGDVDLAISHINRSLRNKPNQPELVQMREDLLGERSVYADDGDVLDSIFKRSFNQNGVNDDGVVEPISDPLSSRIDTKGSMFGQMTAVPAFAAETKASAAVPVEMAASADDAAETDAEPMTSPETAVELAVGEDASVDMGAESTPSTDTPVEMASVEDAPAEMDAEPMNEAEGNSSAADEFEAALASAYLGGEPAVESGEFESFDKIDADGSTDPLVDSTDAPDEFKDAPTEIAPVESSDETTGATFAEETDVDSRVFAHDADATKDVRPEDVSSTMASAQEVRDQASMEDAEAAPFTFADEVENFTSEVEPAEAFEESPQGEVSDETEHEFEEEMAMDPQAFADADDTEMMAGSNDKEFNVFLDSLFRTRLVNWWIAQSKEKAILNENFASVDDE